VNQPAGGSCRECAEESECKRLRERLFGGIAELELRTD
jgi:hypothetical protein